MTIQHFADSDTAGNIIGFYNDDVWDPAKIPTTAIPITEDEWLDCISNQGKWMVDKASSALALVPPPTTSEALAAAKSTKLAELLAAYEAACVGGFPSAATGPTLTYLNDPVSMAKFNGQLHLFVLDSTITQEDWYTVESGMVTHTKDQLIQVFKDGAKFERDQRTKYDGLVASVKDAATDTVDKVNALTY